MADEEVEEVGNGDGDIRKQRSDQVVMGCSNSKVRRKTMRRKKKRKLRRNDLWSDDDPRRKFPPERNRGVLGRGDTQLVQKSPLHSINWMCSSCAPEKQTQAH
ncbi:hypothetical protein VFPPC_17479 [Pochonia chlamydosporia 170]|uniref:Uncharacterized protein n=1 Tax=Pochonia chlamydosporia 170 TaxID=1380566 RepID=A0A219ARF2_METCM|nr:hypothetical protein VFPPC_17479 [Pochonia chlamydosporia 170]OWT43358.1 hypothetical protein VFPPC_17479 [Pochonia chlamydosporia 170]